jgi:adenosylcobinamide-phosphate synthase
MPRLFFTKTSAIEDDEIVRMIVTVVSENTLDAVVAPIFWGTVAGVPGLLGYRAINNLDGIIGMLSNRYQRFGWAAARLDDWANWLPARIAALATIGCAPAVGGSPSRAWYILRRDAVLDPSPNSGLMYGAFCGALDVTLERQHWALDRCRRFRIGDGPPPQIQDALRAIILSRTVSIACTVVLVLSLYVIERSIGRAKNPG